MRNVTGYSIGVDLHDKVLQYCVFDGSGTPVHENEVKIPSGTAALQVLSEFEPWRTDCRLAVEAVGLNRWFVNGLLERGYDVVVVDATKLNLKMLGKKTDKRDAQEIARRLWLGDIDRNAATYYPDDLEYGDRKLERVRHSLVQQRQLIGNQIRAMLRAYKVKPPATVLHGVHSMEQLSRMTLVNEQMTLCLHQLVGVLASLTAAIRALQEQIEKRAAADAAVSLVKSLDGLGAMSALTIVKELGDVHRFRDAKAVASYAGLVPRVNESADRSHHGRLTKRGNRELRFVLCQWAVRLLSTNPMVKAWGERRRKRQHWNKVRMALARKLLIGIWVMLHRGEAFDLERCLSAA